jgi:hypothetical protein
VTSQFLPAPSNSKMNSSTSPRWSRYFSRRCCLQMSAVCFCRFLVPNPISCAEFLYRSCRIMDHVGSGEQTMVRRGFHWFWIRHNRSNDEKVSGSSQGSNWATLTSRTVGISSAFSSQSLPADVRAKRQFKQPAKELARRSKDSIKMFSLPIQRTGPEKAVKIMSDCSSLNARQRNPGQQRRAPIRHDP